MAKRLVGLIFRRNSDGDNKSEKERKELQDAKTKEVQEAVDTVAAEIAAKALSIVQAQLHENGHPSEGTGQREGRRFTVCLCNVVRQSIGLDPVLGKCLRPSHLAQ